MSLRVAYRAAARMEFEDAAAWYNAEHEGLGEEFIVEIDELLSRASAHPERYPIVSGDVRKAVARRFPYSVFFRTRGALLVVLAVFHSRRDPRIWQSRI